MTMDGQDVTRMVGSNNTATRWQYQQLRDERLFRAGWYADFRQRWRAALATEHLHFLARLEAV